MWQCPKCNREFAKTNQDHYCGKIETIDQYISEQTEEVQPILKKIREVIRIAAPDATEKMSWQMPTFWQGENLIHFAAFKKHISIFPGGEASTVFADKLIEYKTSKGTIQFPLNKPIPYDLIKEITQWRVAQVTGELIISPASTKTLDWYLAGYEQDLDRYDWGDSDKPKGREQL